MRTLQNQLLAAVGVFVGMLCSVADAAVLTTPAVRLSNHVVRCTLVNLSTAPRQFAIEMVRANGTVFLRLASSQTLGGAPPIPPGGIATASSGANELLYCRLTLTDVATANMRGAITNESTGLGFPAE
jgi:hypothetical protein